MPKFGLPMLQSTYSLLTPRNYRKTGTPCLRPGEMGRNPSTKRDSASTIDRGQNGHNPPSFSLRSLRSGGATALCRATKDIDLAERVGRWETQSISEHIWERRQMMAGLIDLMVIGGRTIHSATNSPAGTKQLGHDSQIPGRLMVGAMSQGLKVAITMVTVVGVAPPRGVSRCLETNLS